MYLVFTQMLALHSTNRKPQTLWLHSYLHENNDPMEGLSHGCLLPEKTPKVS